MISSMFVQITRFIGLALTLSVSIHHADSAVIKRQIPADATGVKTIIAPSGAQLRYKEPGTEGVCETTPGVNSYSGYVDLDPETHMFFWFFEARQNPAEAPITLWYDFNTFIHYFPMKSSVRSKTKFKHRLNGGPGSDSLIGLFQGKIISIPREDAGIDPRQNSALAM